MGDIFCFKIVAANGRVFTCSHSTCEYRRQFNDRKCPLDYNLKKVTPRFTIFMVINELKFQVLKKIFFLFIFFFFFKIWMKFFFFFFFFFFKRKCFNNTLNCLWKLILFHADGRGGEMTRNRIPESIGLLFKFVLFIFSNSLWNQFKKVEMICYGTRIQKKKEKRKKWKKIMWLPSTIPFPARSVQGKITSKSQQVIRR